ncbi:methyl-accepting chemotaxis protein [Candidatus Chlorohelix sp.]|uniref:methyl-accepting chemotaxis protein n=1 Tax=Candidatus Chlorohelix sp. TaxID=3139201 RepID=UPI00306F5C66
MTANQTQLPNPAVSKLLVYSITSILTILAITIWWFYGNSAGNNYTNQVFWKFLIDLVLVLALGLMNIRIAGTRLSIATTIIFSAMLTLPITLLPVFAFTIIAIYYYLLPTSRGNWRTFYGFIMFNLVFFAGAATFRLFGSTNIEKLTGQQLVAVLLAFSTWIISNYGLIVLRDYLLGVEKPFTVIKKLPTTLPIQLIVIPIGLLHSVILTNYDNGMIVLWCLVIVATGIFTNHLVLLQEQLQAQNNLLSRQKSQLESVHQRELGTGNALADSAEELSYIAFEQSASISQQFMQLSELSKIVDQLNRSAETIAESAYRVLQSTEQSLRSAEVGQDSLNTSLVELADLQISLEGLVEQTTEMAVQSKEINQLSEVLQEIAEETHLLAVNATIEASGAGEYGYRFAVVANEVNQLAGRARSGSLQVQKVISRLRKIVESVLDRIEQSRDQSREAVSNLNVASQRTAQVIEATQHATVLSRQISGASQQQSNGMQQTANGLSLLLQIANEAVKISEKSRETATRLDKLSEILHNGSSQFPRNEPPVSPNNAQNSALVSGNFRPQKA